MRRALVCVLVAGPLFLGGGGPVSAQINPSPESLYVALHAGEEATATLALTNGGSAPLRYCLDFDRPLQRRPDDAREGSTCRPPGGRLFHLDRVSGSSLTMTPDGRLFVAEYTPFGYTRELTADLQFVRYFAHPFVAELTPFAVTFGVTYNEDTGTLWWTNVEESAGVVQRVLLLEGDFDGVATGRRIELPVPSGPPPSNSGYPKGASYDPALKRYYYVDGPREELWAVDTAGVVEPGYPVTLAAYPSGYLGHGADAHGGSGGDPGGVRVEVSVGLGFDLVYDRVVVTDAQGADLGLETPLPALGGDRGGPQGTSVRSRLDPNGVLYMPYTTFDSSGVAAIRPVPLAPTWLGLEAWNGWVEAGASVEIALTFRAGGRTPGVYRSTLAVEDTTGAVLAQVPLVLEVLPGTAEEPGPDESGVRLAVVPNPSRGAATVTLALPAPSRVTLAVYDVLGREVAVLQDGPLGGGTHAFRLDGSAVPVGVYVVRAAADGAALTRRLTLLR